MDDYLTKPVKIKELAAILQFCNANSPTAENDSPGIFLRPAAEDADESPVAASENQSPNRAAADSPYEDFDREIVQLFFTEISRQVEEIHRALETGAGAEDIARLAHAARGNSLALKAFKTAEAAAQIETAARQADLEKIPPLLQSLKDEIAVLNKKFTRI